MVVVIGVVAVANVEGDEASLDLVFVSIEACDGRLDKSGLFLTDSESR